VLDLDQFLGVAPRMTDLDLAQRLSLSQVCKQLGDVYMLPGKKMTLHQE